ncbi:MAG: hypothetical protein OER88_05430 [Planctomycetota bacterium]|nr:hypothetical protein [Planctomycetota bacterium]
MVVLAACGPPPAPGSLVIHIDRTGLDRKHTPAVWLRGDAGIVAHSDHRAFAFARGADPVSYDHLPPGRYEIAGKLGLGLNSPFVFVTRSVDVLPGTRTEIKLALRTNRTARLALDVERGSPPYLLLVADPARRWPTELPDLQAELAQDRYPEGLRLWIQSSGRSKHAAMPPGDYVALVVANDWQTGDPPIRARTVAITLRAGAKTTLRITDKLRKLHAE